MNTLLSHLREFGLSEKEGLIYQALLILGPTSAHEIAKETKLNRSSVYVLLNTLVEQGFVEQSQRNGILNYQAVSPEKLIERADELVRSSSRQEEEMDSLLPELLSVSKKLKNQPRVVFYEGVGGIETVSNDLLTQPSETQVYAFVPISKTLLESKFSLLESPDLQYRYKTKIISSHEKVGRVVLDEKKELEVRCLPANKYLFSSELRIYADKIVFISTVEEFGVIIQSQDVADVMRNLFNLAWEEARRLDAQIRNKITKEEKDKSKSTTPPQADRVWLR